jgi:hypothetical protein
VTGIRVLIPGDVSCSLVCIFTGATLYFHRALSECNFLYCRSDQPNRCEDASGPISAAFGQGGCNVFLEISVGYYSVRYGASVDDWDCTYGITLTRISEFDGCDWPDTLTAEIGDESDCTIEECCQDTGGLPTDLTGTFSLVGTPPDPSCVLDGVSFALVYDAGAGYWSGSVDLLIDPTPNLPDTFTFVLIVGCEFPATNLLAFELAYIDPITGNLYPVMIGLLSNTIQCDPVFFVGFGHFNGEGPFPKDCFADGGLALTLTP